MFARSTVMFYTKSFLVIDDYIYLARKDIFLLREVFVEFYCQKHPGLIFRVGIPLWHGA
jgi:hypothetical protein